MRFIHTAAVRLALALLLGACAAPTALPTDPPPTATPTDVPTTAVPPTASPIPSATVTPTEPPTATPLPTDTATPEPSATHTPEPPTATSTRPPVTAAPTLAPTLAATVAPSPAPAGGPVAPGLYPQSPTPCGVYEVLHDQFWIRVTFCTVSVRVQPTTGNMEFNVTWSVEFLAGIQPAKGSDQDNPNMYIVDNLGHHYAHIGTNGAAKLGGRGAFMDGVFIFGPAQPGATVFAFHDDDQGIVVPNISLAGPPQ